jgi:UDP-GlcNAc3NAcA epimerase
MKVLTVIGARPQIIKAAALSRAIRESFSGSIHEIIIHTGQHYDKNMSGVFFEEMNIPKPDINLNVGSASHGLQTAKMTEGLEKMMLEKKPDVVVLYGDTNSTLAGAIAAAKIHIPIAHVEAGLRSFNKSMPEEINRIVCDHCSTLLFSPTHTGVKNLRKEGFDMESKPPFNMDNPAVFHCGDIMYDNALHYSDYAHESLLSSLKISKNNYVLTTIHRDSNTDDPERLNSIFAAIDKLSNVFHKDFVIPLHPRTSKLLKKNLDSSLYKKIIKSSRIKISEPVSYLEMLVLEKNAELILTDSGGVQKEAYFFKKPGIIMRPQTEWVEIVENKCAVIADADKNKIVNAFTHFQSSVSPEFPPVFGDGHAAEFICEQMLKL